MDLAHLERGIPVLLNLFADVSLRASSERIDWRPGGDYTWYGPIEGTEQGQAILVVQGGDAAGNITLPGASYQIRPLGDGVHLIREIDPSAFPDEGPPERPPLPLERGSTSRDAQGAGDDGSVIDVLVAYTENAANASASILAEIQLAIDETNASYANSQIDQRVNLVGTYQVSYTEEGNLVTDLAYLTGDSEGRMDEVHTIRDETCADLVSLWVEHDPWWCGYAWLMEEISSSFAPWGFSVVRRDCATGTFTFGHELGHNMGAHHDRYVAPEDGALAYSHGWVNPRGWVDPAVRWRTIMAYNQRCSDSGFGCTRIPYWSNPEITYGTDPTGVAWDDPNSADNARTLNATAFAVANLRASSECCSVADPGSPDSDCDGALDEVDVCTVLNRSEQIAYKSRVVIKRLDWAEGYQQVTVRGLFNPATLAPQIAPDEKGVHFSLRDGDGVLLDVNIPGGARHDPSASHCSKSDGWKRIVLATGGTSWLYTNRSGALPPNCDDPRSANGVSRVILRDLTSTPWKRFLFIVRARGTTLPRTPAFPIQELQANLALAEQPAPGRASEEASHGQCAETVFIAPSAGPFMPYCKRTPKVGTLDKIICKGQ